MSLPPSPPPSPKHRYPLVDRILRILRLYKVGTLPNREAYEYASFALPADQYAELQRRIGEVDEGWYQDKCRWDYDGGRYTLRMPSRVHERFTALVDEAIYTSLKSLQSEIKALEDVYQGRSTTIALHAPKLENSSQESSEEEIIVNRSPDATFLHKGRDALPMCVVEVSYSQQRKDLPRLAESYIVDSRHEVRCVVGLDIVYGKRDRTASLSIWRPGIEEGDVGVCECEVEGVEFRGVDGGVREGGLELRVGDFVPGEFLREGEGEKRITISFERLAAFLADAESQATPSTKPQTPSAPKKFRKRKRSPSEELSDGREAAYLKLEEAELEKEKKVDAEWRGAGWVKDQVEVEVVERRRSKRGKSGRAVGEAS
ncbi:hypothetical protein PRZ48_008936 [Zasmidium cellare]|uniref:Uncharacterized protein n=1 Tax=Zasmidium cellare TaxID=395010 RepID=A0ABR0EGW2_ZASCE|nr:hypothetical protein PRZ48_008936 [Zasmidium cellare]